MMAGLEVGDSQAPLKPHAQAHLLSPTDKCKVCVSLVLFINIIRKAFHRNKLFKDFSPN